jgi:hypothetical protein
MIFDLMINKLEEQIVPHSHDNSPHVSNSNRYRTADVALELETDQYSGQIYSNKWSGVNKKRLVA